MPDAGRQVPLVIYPRFTTLYGGLALEGYPIDVSAYESVTLHVWTSLMGGTGVLLLQIFFYQSMDRVLWEPFTGVGPLTPLAGVETKQVLKFKSQWFRPVIKMSGTDPLVTLWMEGMLIKRLA